MINSIDKRKQFFTNVVLSKFKARFGNQFDYSRARYVNAKEKIEIICPYHGSFWQTSNNHVNSVDGGCHICKKEKLRKKFGKSDDFFNRSKQIHENKYIYKESKYINLCTKLKIICPDHGEFWQLPANHLKGYGCPSCANRIQDLNSFIHKATTIHGNCYDYSNVEFSSVISPVKIICKEHGEFWQTPANHCNKESKCPKCSGIFVTDTESFLSKARDIHGDRYDYSSSVYVRHDVALKIICKEHGEFWQTPNTHLTAGVIGCQVCSKRYPSWEDELSVILDNWNIEYKQHQRGILQGKQELDFLLPEYNLAIEMCGLYWHSHEIKKDSKYHLSKWIAANNAGISLITIFEDEWIHSKESVLRAIKHKIMLSEKGVFARKCIIKYISTVTAKTFLDEYHLQKSINGTHIGAFYNDILIAVMTFGNPTRQQTKGIELKRFVTNGKSHSGLASKMFSFYIKTNNPELIVSFSDNRWFDGKIYQTLGFSCDGILPPDYYYVRNTNRYHKSRFRKSAIQKKFPEIYDPSLTESQMMAKTPYNKIYDCGKIRWIWKQN